jgi:hypothetical protein
VERAAPRQGWWSRCSASADGSRGVSCLQYLGMNKVAIIISRPWTAHSATHPWSLDCACAHTTDKIVGSY